MNIIDLARTIAPNCKIVFVGIRHGEKLHEVMISSDDSRNTFEFDDYYIIKPDFNWWDNKNSLNGKLVPEGFSYSSSTNPNFLNADQMKNLIKDLNKS